VSENHVFSIPQRSIIGVGDMAKWRSSEAYYEYKGFLQQLNEAVKGKSLSSPFSESSAVGIMINLLDELIALIDKFPPVQQPQRFGNIAFRDFYNNLKEVILDN